MFSHVLERQAARLIRSDLLDDRYLGGERFLISVETFWVAGDRLPDSIHGPVNGLALTPGALPDHASGASLRHGIFRDDDETPPDRRIIGRDRIAGQDR